MKSVFDNSDIEIPCPHCGKKTKQRIGRVKHDKNFTCPGCGKVSALDASGLRDGLKGAQRSLDDFARSLRKLGK
jgi:endogenous inhibitor of DNA gyrase (YacG/DUF329 family)